MRYQKIYKVKKHFYETSFEEYNYTKVVYFIQNKHHQKTCLYSCSIFTLQNNTKFNYRL